MTPLFPRKTVLSEIGSQLTQSLFYEYRHQTTASPSIYTLKDTDWEGCISMYRIYMESGSEYEAGMKLLGSWAHWTKLCRCTWFKPYVEDWRLEREVREAAIGKKTLIEQAEQGSVSAAKELVNQVTKRAKIGRPSKQEAKDHKSKMQMIDNKVISLLERAPHV